MSNDTPLNGSQPAPQKVVINHAFNIRQKIDPVQIELFREGPTALIVAAAERLAQGLGGLPDSPKYDAFLRAARKHGVKLILTIAVEEPAVVQ